MSESVTYTFHEANHVEAVVKLCFADDTFLLQLPDDLPTPDWTRLDFMPCPNCTLDPLETHCPAALCLSSVLDNFAHVLSYAEAVVQVETPNRIVVSKAPIQYGVASLFGLVLASSGCPRTEFLRPMARFHLPFPDQRETVSRSLGTWLLAEYIRSGASGQPAALSFDGLTQAYGHVRTVNAALAERLRTTVTHDAALNAIIILDAFALITPENVESGFQDIANYVDTDPKCSH